MELEVLSPLNKLLVMFQGPTKVIKKRHDKLLDYDNMQSKVKGVKDTTQQKIVSLPVKFNEIEFYWQTKRNLGRDPVLQLLHW